MILKTLLSVLGKTASEDPVKYLGGMSAKKSPVQTLPMPISTEKESKVKKQKNGLSDTVKSFMGRSRATIVCSVCNTTYYEGALDFLSDEVKSCPACDNGKDEQ